MLTVPDHPPFGGSKRLVSAEWLTRGAALAPLIETLRRTQTRSDEILIEGWPWGADSEHPLRATPRAGAADLVVYAQLSEGGVFSNCLQHSHEACAANEVGFNVQALEAPILTQHVGHRLCRRDWS